MNDPQTIGINKGKLVLLLILGLALGAGSAWLISLPYNPSQSDLWNTWRTFAGWMGIPLCLFLVFASVLSLADQHMGIRMDKSGLYYKTSVFARGFIAWENIISFDLTQKGRYAFIVIERKNEKPAKVMTGLLAEPADEVRNKIKRYHQSQTRLVGEAQKKRW